MTYFGKHIIPELDRYINTFEKMVKFDLGADNFLIFYNGFFTTCTKEIKFDCSSGVLFSNI